MTLTLTPSIRTRNMATSTTAVRAESALRVLKSRDAANRSGRFSRYFGRTDLQGKIMHLQSASFFRGYRSSVALAVSALAALAITLPGFAAEAAPTASGTTNESCASSASSTSAASSASSASSAWSASSVGAGSNRSHTSTARTHNGRDDQINRECQRRDCGLSSSITTGPSGISGLTKMPDGSSVTVQSGSGLSGSSTVTPGSSSPVGESTTAAHAEQGSDCVTHTGPR
jgi:hypothetical protein